jgi:hypothetical protein
MAAWRIPAMTDPLGKHWRQPLHLRDRVALYETHATIAEHDWLVLHNYESSYPSGVYPGKVWRRGPWLCWYGPLTKDAQGRECCRIGVLRALVQ